MPHFHTTLCPQKCSIANSWRNFVNSKRNFQNSFATGKRTKFPTKPIQYFPPSVCWHTTLQKLEVSIMVNLTIYDLSSRQHLISLHRICSTEQYWPQPCRLGLEDMGHHPATSLSVMGAQYWWTEAAFAARLAWHWPDHHWQCNWWVAWASSCMCAGKRETLRATIVTMFSQMFQFLSNVTIFFCKLPQFRTSNFCKVVWQHTDGMMGSIIWDLLKI